MFACKGGEGGKSVSQLFHGPAPRSPLHRLAVRLRHSRSNTSTEYSLPGATQFPGYIVSTASWEATGVLYRGGVIKLPRARSARVFSPPQARNFGDIDCKSLHLGPEIDATHTLLTATYMYVPLLRTTTMTHYKPTMTKATVSIPYPPALSTAWPGSIANSSLK